MEELDIGIDWGEEIGLDWEAPVSGFKPRHYQIEATDAVHKGWEQYDTQFIELATGCGKTVIFSGICNDHVIRKERCLVLAHREELVDQAMEKMRDFYHLHAGKEQAHHKASIYDDVVCASVQTMSGDSRLSGWNQSHFDLVIVDECHRTLAKSYLKVLDYFKDGGAKILGVTATADRGDKRNLGEFYEHCAYEYNLLRACKDGYLVSPVVLQVPIKIDLQGIKSRRTSEGSDLDVTEVSKRISPYLAEIAKAIATEAPDRKTVIFMPSIETAQMMAEELRNAGLNGEYVSGACPDRNRKIADFKSGKIQYLCNAMLLTEGFDDDSISCVVVLRPTKIRALYTQCVGRGTRPINGCINGVDSAEERRKRIAESSKPDLLILDFLWMTGKLNLVNPVDLVAGGRKEIRKRMLKDGGQGNLIELQEEAERDMLTSLEDNVRKNSGKKKRMIDPLQFAVITGDAHLADWEATEKWQEEKLTENQNKALTKAGIDPDAVQCRGLAARIIDRLFMRQKLGLATPKQLGMLKRMKVEGADKISMQQAGKLIGEFLADKKKKKKTGYMVKTWMPETNTWSKPVRRDSKYG